MIYAFESIADVHAEVDFIGKKVWEEIGFFDGKTDLDVEHYKEVEDLDCLLITTCRDNNRLVGYSFCYIQWHPHFQQLFGVNDMLYVDPEYRNVRIGEELLEMERRRVKDKGGVYHMFALRHGRHSQKFAINQGYEPVDINYGRAL